MPIFRLIDDIVFPDPKLAENGILAVGGDLSPDSSGQNTQPKKPTIIKRKKKKKVEGGC